MHLGNSLIGAAIALLLMTSAASAVTVTNKDTSPHKIGIDWGAKESVETVGAGKSAKINCPDGCGISGPWGFSWMAKGDDTITTDGKSLVTFYDKAFKGHES